LQKAREEMLKNQESLEDEDEDSDDEADDGKSPASIATSLRNGESTTDNGDLYATLAGGWKGRRRPGMKSLKRVIELAIFTDERFWRKWASTQPTDTETKINQYILALVNNVFHFINYSGG